jgi:hypothetical protein
MDVHEIKSALTLLTKADLKDIKKVCEVLIARGGEIEEETELFYEAILTALSKHDLNPVSIHLLKSNKKETFNKIEETATNVLSWMRSVGVKRKIEQKLFLHILSEMVIEAISNTNIPLNTNTMLAFFSKAPSLFENNFPGYIESGTVIFLIHSRRAKNV